MKIFKKALCVILSAIMLMSCLSVSLVAFAADARSNELYRALAYSFFNYRTIPGVNTRYELVTDDNGNPVRTLVGDMSQYTVSNITDDYKYADANDSPIRAIAYDHKVTAKDNSSGAIRNALTRYLGLADAVMSTTYGTGNYTIPMICDAITENLRLFKGDNGEYLFLDGYTYYVRNTGELVGRSAEKTYEVVDGQVKYFGGQAPEAPDRNQKALTLYEYANVATVMSYFSGSCISVNSGNWFHKFIIEVVTDLETVLVTEPLTSNSFTERTYEVTWTMNRSYDESGTKAQFYNNGYEVTKDISVTNNTRAELVNLDAELQSYFDKYYADGVLKNMTNAQIINSEYSNIRRNFEKFNSLSNKAKLAVFGQDALSYMNLVTQLTPIVDSRNFTDRYYPYHTYDKYKDKSGNNIVYKVDNTKITSIVNTIDDLLKSERVGAVLKTFLDFSDPKYADKSFYGTDPKTAQEVIQLFIRDYVYSDNIINMLIGMVYPMISNLLDANVTDALLPSLGLNSTVVDLINYAVENSYDAKGLHGFLNTTLAMIGVSVTPAGIAKLWNQFGYINESTNPGWSAVFKRNHDILMNARGGDYYQTFGGVRYYGIGAQNDSYYGDRWRDVDTSKLVWGINGDKNKFQTVLCGVLLPVVSLLCGLLGNQQFKVMDGSDHYGIPVKAVVIGVPIWVFASVENTTLYNDVLLPLLESLEIPNLTSGRNFEAAAAAANTESGRNPDSVQVFLNTILNPLLNWVENTLLADPIKTILKVLPNLSYYLTSGALLSSINNVNIPIRISIGIDSAKITVYTLKLGELLGNTIAFLDSLQGIIDLIGINVDTGIPIVGYHAEGDNKVYRPDTAGYNETTMNIAVTEAYANANGDMNMYSDDEYNIPVTGRDADGNITAYAIFERVGWANAAGDVVTAHNDTDATESEYYIEVTKYYEYTVTDEETGESATVRTVNQPDDTVTYNTVISYRTEQAKAQLPAIMDYKLQACGTVETTSSGRYNDFNVTNSSGSETWYAGQRKHIAMQVGGKESHGLVLLFIFRYLFSALQYRAYDVSQGVFTNDYTLLDAFGISDMLNNELFAGMKLIDVINNISLHPDEAIAALLELFYKNEFGSIWKVLGEVGNRRMVKGDDYSYTPTKIEYYTDNIMTNAQNHNDYSYGTAVLYTEYWSKEDSSYIINNLDDLLNNVFAMLKLDGIDSLGGYLDNMLAGFLFNNNMISNLVGMLYGALDSIAGIDLGTILNAALDVDYSKRFLAEAIKYEFDGVETEVYKKLKKDADTYVDPADPDYKDKLKQVQSYDKDYFYVTNYDVETGAVTRGDALDWGFNNTELTAKYTSREIFVKAISAALSPFAVLVRFLFGGEDLSLLNLINIPGYEIYQGSWIPFMETLTATRGLIPFEEFFQKIMIGDNSGDVSDYNYRSEEYLNAHPVDQTKAFVNTVHMNCDAFYYSFVPAFNFVEDLLANPVSVLMNMLPNLMFFISIGGLNGLINNFVHFAYVLLDIIEPIFDVYPVINSLISNLNVGGMTINLSLPLDLDVNQLVNSLVDGLLGNMLKFDIENKNIVLGEKTVEKEVFVPELDSDGQEMVDEEGNVIGTYEMQTVTEPVYAVGTLRISLPELDLSTLCCGTVQEKTSLTGDRYVFLNSSGGADFITLVLRLVTDTLFYKDNAMNIADFLIGFCQLDDEVDNDELLIEIFTYLNDEAQNNKLPDKSMKLVFTVYKILVPIADNLGGRFKKVDFSITQLFQDKDKLSERMEQLINAGDSDNPKLSLFARLIKLLKSFFEKIKIFFQKMFGKA